MNLTKWPLTCFFFIFSSCIVERTQGEDYNILQRDGSFEFGYDTPDSYHKAQGNRNNVVRGQFGGRNPGTGAIDSVDYTAGPRGFRPRGKNVVRKYDLSQIGPRPIGSKDDPYFDPSEDPSYNFAFRTRTYNRDESANRVGDVNGRFSYIDDVGETHNVEFIAGKNTGFHVKTPFPDSNPRAYGPLFFNGRGKPIPRGRTAIQRGLDGSYRFISAGPDQRRTETSDSQGNVRGSYTYLDPKGIQHSVHYIAGPEIGYRVLKNVKGPHIPSVYPFNRPEIVSPDFYNDLDDKGVGDVFHTAASGHVKPTPSPAFSTTPRPQDIGFDDGESGFSSLDDNFSSTRPDFVSSTTIRPFSPSSRPTRPFGPSRPTTFGSSRPPKRPYGGRPTRPQPNRPTKRPSSQGTNYRPAFEDNQVSNVPTFQQDIGGDDNVNYQNGQSQDGDNDNGLGGNKRPVFTRPNYEDDNIGGNDDIGDLFGGSVGSSTYRPSSSSSSFGPGNQDSSSSYDDGSYKPQSGEEDGSYSTPSTGSSSSSSSFRPSSSSSSFRPSTVDDEDDDDDDIGSDEMFGSTQRPSSYPSSSSSSSFSSSSSPRPPYKRPNKRPNYDDNGDGNNDLSDDFGLFDNGGGNKPGTTTYRPPSTTLRPTTSFFRPTTTYRPSTSSSSRPNIFNIDRKTSTVRPTTLRPSLAYIPSSSSSSSSRPSSYPSSSYPSSIPSSSPYPPQSSPYPLPSSPYPPSPSSSSSSSSFYPSTSTNRPQTVTINNGNCSLCSGTIVRNIGDKDFLVPAGLAVKAQVHSIDLLPVDFKVPSPSEQYIKDALLD